MCERKPEPNENGDRKSSARKTKKRSTISDNIEDILTLAKQSLVDQLVTECTEFLMNVVRLDKLSWRYELAMVLSFCFVYHLFVVDLIKMFS